MSVLKDRIRRMRAKDADSGVAMMAAVGVAVVGIAFSVLVVAQAVIILNDTARDRVRTVEIHAAEGALDAALFELQGAPLRCGGPEFSPVTVGEGRTAVEVTIEYMYFDDSGEMNSCFDGMLQGVPTHAIIRSTAEAIQPVHGVPAVRQMETRINLIPSVTEGVNAAIFAGNQLTTTNPLSVIPENPGGRASIWVEGNNQNWTCQSGATITGDVIVVRGSVNFQSSGCRVLGNVWARSGFSACCTTAGGNNAIDGHLTVRNGNLTVQNANMKFGKNVTVGGNTGAFHWGTAQVGGRLCANNHSTQCTAADFGEDYQPVGIPEIDFEIAALIADGYTLYTKDDFFNQFITQANATLAWQQNGIRNANCNMGPWMWYNGATVRFNFPTHKAVYDLRTCVWNPQSVPFFFYNDTIIYTRSFQTNGPVTFNSGDGVDHTVGVIVPEGGTAYNGIAECTTRSGSPSYTPGEIRIATNFDVLSPIKALFYTPCNVQFHNKSTLRGQLYGNNITINENNSVFQYTELEIPGVAIGTPSVSSDGYLVEVVYKRELRN